MNVILHTADHKGFHTVFSGDPADVFPEAGLDIGRDRFTTVLRREDAVK